MIQSSAPAVSMRAILAALLLSLAAASGGCENSFSPKAPFHPSLVVFCVLDASRDVQYIRIERSYDAAVGGTPVPLTPTQVDSAVVTVTGDSRVVHFHDTTIAVQGGGATRVWIARNFRPAAEKPYVLTVTVPGFAPVGSAMQMPGKLYLHGTRITGESVIPALELAPGADPMRFPPAGIYFRLFVQGRTLRGADSVVLRGEVAVQRDPLTGAAIYPIPSRDFVMSFPNQEIRAAHDTLFGRDTTVRNLVVIALGYAMDNNFYRYYKAVRGFDDPVSTRLDHPDISFIDGGFGVFGGMLPDSVAYDYFYVTKN